MGGLFAIMALIGAASVTIFPLGLELAMEVTRNAGSSAVLWFMSVSIYPFAVVSRRGAVVPRRSAVRYG